jgi:hypothetical protein
VRLWTVTRVINSFMVCASLSINGWRCLGRIETGLVQIVAKALGQFLELDPRTAGEGLANTHHLGHVDFS